MKCLFCSLVIVIRGSACKSGFKSRDPGIHFQSRIPGLGFNRDSGLAFFKNTLILLVLKLKNYKKYPNFTNFKAEKQQKILQFHYCLYFGIQSQDPKIHFQSQSQNQANSGFGIGIHQKSKHKSLDFGVFFPTIIKYSSL